MESNYHLLETRDLLEKPFFTKPGVRGYPALPPGLELLARRADLSAGSLLDLSFSAGGVALVSEATERTVYETSCAALRAATRTLEGTNVTLKAAAPWDAVSGAFDKVALVPSADRGNVRVRAELAAAHAALKEGGIAYIVMSKDLGAKRYEDEAEALFGSLNVIAKSGGWRLARAVKRKLDTQAVEPVLFEAAGLRLEALPGVFAAGKLDPGTEVLLKHLDLARLAGKRVLDVGCGYGTIALKAAQAGVAVTALDDDLLAVRSTEGNAARYELNITVLHSDVDSALAPEPFDTILMNPPFHVGKKVLLAVPRAFLAAGRSRLSKGGDLILVANAALPYEADLNPWAEVTTLAQEGGFKVLRARKR